ncbi:MAG: ASCH domain-containing protein [Lachnospiraceae bacterium]|nr:ASCH domain-containing protein [Lachnospiraceae bacterium]
MSRVLPILFNADMVRAILDGRKTVTRRKIDIDVSNQFDVESDRRTIVAYINPETGDSYEPTKICRYQPGDILYVRETWCKGSLDYHEEHYYYRADNNEFPCKWRPSIHMPKEAARIWLKVTDVRVERLQDITEEQAVKEGGRNNIGFIHSPENEYDTLYTAKENFRDNIWNSTIKKPDIDRYGWEANPWVWVIEFERCEKPEENDNIKEIADFLNERKNGI